MTVQFRGNIQCPSLAPGNSGYKANYSAYNNTGNPAVQTSSAQGACLSFAGGAGGNNTASNSTSSGSSGGSLNVTA